jgi:hypothetical protein
MNDFTASTASINPSWNTINNQTVLQVEHCTSFDNNEVVVNEVVPHEVPTSVATAPVAEVEIASNKYNNLQWVDCDFNEEGKPVGVQGKLWNQLSVAKLRIICRRLQVYGFKNVRKEGIIEAIGKTYHNTTVSAAIKKNMDPTVTSTTRKEVQCPYRLLNILFSDDFANEFATIGNSATRSTLDTGKAANDEIFWTKIQNAFMDNKSDYNILQFQDNDVFESETINPSKAVGHDWKKTTEYLEICER